MTRDQINHALSSAIRSLIERDFHLLSVDVSERCLTHRLALYLTQGLSDYDVDCEYNRDGFDVKRLALSERPARDDDVEAVTVFPDIVVHRRGNNEHNLLVIEMKKYGARTAPDYDIQKLKAFRSELRYNFAAHVIIGVDRAGK